MNKPKTNPKLLYDLDLFEGLDSEIPWKEPSEQAYDGSTISRIDFDTATPYMGLKFPSPANDPGRFHLGVDPYMSLNDEDLASIGKTAEEVMLIFKEYGTVFIPVNESLRTIHLVILGEPKAQKRHRSVKMGNFIQQYDPSAKDKDDLLYVVQQQAPKEPFTSPIKLDVAFYFSRPKSHYKSGKNAHILKESCPQWHTTKPDADNCIKLVQDSLNKVFYRDDSLICQVSITKRYDVNPRIEINISPL